MSLGSLTVIFQDGARSMWPLLELTESEDNKGQLISRDAQTSKIVYVTLDISFAEARNKIIESNYNPIVDLEMEQNPEINTSQTWLGFFLRREF